MPLNDTIGSVMESKNRKIWAVTPITSVYDALCVMAEPDIGAVLVCRGERCAA
jgi:CBS domain-containing protein